MASDTEAIIQHTVGPTPLPFFSMIGCRQGDACPELRLKALHPPAGAGATEGVPEFTQGPLEGIGGRFFDKLLAGHVGIIAQGRERPGYYESNRANGCCDDANRSDNTKIKDHFSSTGVFGLEVFLSHGSGAKWYDQQRCDHEKD